MVLLLVRHDPAFGVKVDNMLEVLGLEKELSKRKEQLEKELSMKKGDKQRAGTQTDKRKSQNEHVVGRRKTHHCQRLLFVGWKQF